MVLLHIIHSLLSLKFKSTLAKIATIYINISFFNKYVLFFPGRCFSRKKTPGGHAAGLAPGVWSYPLAFRSLVVKHTAWTQNWPIFDTFDTFSPISKYTICSQNDHINDLELSFSAPFSKSRCASFPCWKKHWFSCF